MAPSIIFDNEELWNSESIYEAKTNVSWAPDWTEYQTRLVESLKSGQLERCLPNDMPQAVSTRMTWTGEQLRDEREYIHSLSHVDQQEIEDALRYFKDLGLDGDQVQAEHFPLPSLQHHLRRLCVELHSGKGFFVIRGLDATKHTAEDNALILLGLSSYIAERRGRQDQHGNMLVHIIDDDNDRKTDIFPRDSTLHLPYHTDLFCDVLAMQTRTGAATGGSSLIASMETVYNEIARTRPDLIHTLTKADWPCDTYRSEPRITMRPLLFYHDQKLICNFSRGLFTNPDATRPPLSVSQLEAIDAIHYTAERHHLDISTQPGDIQFLNNLGLLHGRKAFVDSPGNNRHLVRLWLQNRALAWKLPDVLQLARERVYEEDDEIDELWELMPLPMPRPSYHHCKYAGN